MIVRPLKSRRLLVALSLAAATACSARATSAPDAVAPIPHAITADRIGSTIPYWESSFAYGGTTYSLRIVGTDPTLGGAVTTIPNEIVPVTLVFSDGTRLDARQDADSLPASPLYVAAPFTSGDTQFGDAMQRFELWTYINGETYDVLLAAPVVASNVVVQVPSDKGSTWAGPDGSVHGTADFDWFINTLEPQLISQLGISASTLTVFVTHNLTLQRGTAIYSGFHSDFNVGTSTYTTAWASTTPTFVWIMAHEIAEWLNDPFNDNAVPRWVNPVTSGCGSARMEVVDPVTKYSFKSGTYRLPDMAALSWFRRDVPSIALNGLYDYLGDVTGPAGVC